MSNESTHGYIENSGDHSEASLVPNEQDISRDMISLAKPAVESETIEPSSKDIVLQRLSAGSSWDNLKDAPSSDEPQIEPDLETPMPPSIIAKRSLPMAAIVAIAAVMGAVGGSAGTLGIGYLTSPKTDVAEHTRIIESLIAKVNSDITSVKNAATAQSQKVAKLSDTIEKLRTQEATGSIAAPAPATVAPFAAAQPNRLPVVEGWYVREVNGNAAILQGRDGIYEVLVGDPLPGVGRVDAIRRQDGRWTVVTSRGLIVAR